MTELPDWATIAALIVAALNLSWGIWVWVAAARQRALTELEARVGTIAAALDAHKAEGASSRGELKDRLVHVEEQLAHMPTAESQHRLELGLAELRGAIGTISEALKPLARTSARIEDYLLEERRK